MKRISTKACDISQSVKESVWERDRECCIYCGNPYASPNAHYIPRSQLGLGIEQNIVTLCANCHHNFDHTELRPFYKEYIRDYLKGKYEDWDETKLVYKKDTWLDMKL